MSRASWRGLGAGLLGEHVKPPLEGGSDHRAEPLGRDDRDHGVELALVEQLPEIGVGARNPEAGRGRVDALAAARPGGHALHAGRRQKRPDRARSVFPAPQGRDAQHHNITGTMSS